MRWVAPTEKDTANETLEKRLWAAADQFRANSGLKAAQYSAPVLGLIFLRFAEARFAKRRAQLEKAGASPRRGNSRIDDPKAYMAEGVLYLTPGARFDYLLQRPEGSNVGRAVNEAMADIEKHNPQLAGVLPRNYQIFNGILTLMSVYWDEGRHELERFSRAAKKPAKGPTPYNHFLQPSPDQLLLAAVGYGFKHFRAVADGLLAAVQGSLHGGRVADRPLLARAAGKLGGDEMRRFSQETTLFDYKVNPRRL